MNASSLVANISTSSAIRPQMFRCDFQNKSGRRTKLRRYDESILDFNCTVLKITEGNLKSLQ